MLTVVRSLIVVLLLVSSRMILIGTVLFVSVAAWAYYGYQQIGCHPMFSSANIDCGSVQALAAEHSLAIVKLLAPYQQQLQDNQTELTLYIGAAVIGAVVIEVIFGFVAIIRRRRAKRDLFKGATAVKEKAD
jgi:hypothetical protein